MPEHPASTRHSRRRLAIWLGFAAVGITMGVVWAAGFASFTGGGNGTAAASPVVTPGSPSNNTNPLAGLVTAGTTWNVDWSGDWGSTGATSFFQIALGSKPTGQVYNLAMLLTNGAAMSAATDPWQTLQLKVELRQAAGASCANSDFASGSPIATHLMSFDNEDAAVYFNGISITNGDNPYCIGIAPAAPPYDGSGTFLRNDGTVPDVYPNFIATVNRVS